MSEVTTLSADPFQQLVDHGFPLYRFREKTRSEFFLVLVMYSFFFLTSFKNSNKST